VAQTLSVNPSQKRWNEKNKPALAAIQRAWRARNLVKIRQKEKLRRESAKLKVLSHYGPNGIPKCSWPKCVIDDLDMLSLDHINDNGNVERREMKLWGSPVYFHLMRRGFPDGYQTLCLNHQHKKRMRGWPQ